MWGDPDVDDLTSIGKTPMTGLDEFENKGPAVVKLSNSYV